MLQERAANTVTLAEKRVNRRPYPIYIRVVEMDTLEGIRYRFEITSNTVQANLSSMYSDREDAMRDFRHAIAAYAAFPGAEHDDIGVL